MGPATGRALTVDITAPMAGYLIIAASVDASNALSGLNDTVVCAAGIGGEVVPGSLMTAELDDLFAYNTEEDCALNATAAVDAGTHTVSYSASDANGSVTYGQGTLTVIWVAYSGTGAEVTITDPAPGASLESAIEDARARAAAALAARSRPGD